jgi:beta-carotene ketolase (CrtW type)
MGLFLAILIVVVWTAHLLYCLFYVPADSASVWFYVHILLQGYLFTGLFITAHDAMHRSVHKNKQVNTVIGWITSFLFAGMSYKRLRKNHFRHHKYPATANDPDFFTKSQVLPVWWGVFMYRYLTVFQFIIMASLFNILLLWFNEARITFFWVVPAFLGTFQLFYFGTYRPHKYPHKESMEPHKARTLKKNHLLAMISCYFFGYHYEHHESPRTPWWKLYQTKSKG